MWPSPNAQLHDAWSDFAYVGGELRYALGLDTPRACEIRATEAALQARVKAVPFDDGGLAIQALVEELKARTAAILADPNLPPEYRGIADPWRVTTVQG